MGKLISLSERMELWKTGYSDPAGRFSIMISNHGRLKFQFRDSDSVVLDFMESVGMLSQLSADFEKVMGVMYEK
jgi:hypothetical protein